MKIKELLDEMNDAYWCTQEIQERVEDGHAYPQELTQAREIHRKARDLYYSALEEEKNKN